MIAVVDYHKGNLKSVERGLVAAGAEVLVTSDPAAIAKAVGEKSLIGDGLFMDRVTRIVSIHHGICQCLRIWPQMVSIKVREHLCAVDALP